jgi:hypothetical protein
MEATGEPCVLRRDGKDVAVVRSVAPVAEWRATSKDDPLWGIVGMFESDGATDVSSNKYKYLAEAYADLHDHSEE